MRNTRNRRWSALRRLCALSHGRSRPWFCGRLQQAGILFVLATGAGCVSNAEIDQRMDEYFLTQEMVEAWFDREIATETDPQIQKDLRRQAKATSLRLAVAGLLFGSPQPPFEKIEAAVAQAREIQLRILRRRNERSGARADTPVATRMSLSEKSVR